MVRVSGRSVLCAAGCVLIAFTLTACGGGAATVQNSPASSGSDPVITTPAPNHAPTITGAAPASVTAGSAYTFTPSASDADGNTLTFSISGKPSWATFNAQTGRLSGAPSANDVGNYPAIAIAVSDGTTSASLASFSIAVAAAAASPPPAVSGSATVSWSAPLQNTDGSTLQDLSGFRIYYGTSAGTLDHTIDVTNSSLSTYTIDNLPSGIWYFGIRSYNASGSESDLSNVGQKKI